MELFLRNDEKKFFKKKMGLPGLFLFIFVFSNTHYKFYNKKVHPVYGAGIWTHDLWNMSLLP